MVRIIKIMLGTAVLGLIILGTAQAQSLFRTRVRVIQADTGPAHVDPGLDDLTRELQTVFKYTSYRLIKTQDMDLKKDQEGRVALPGNRDIVLSPSGMEGSRISYQIRIDRNNQAIFQTRVALQNDKSITIGGPKNQNGVLLLNIFGSAR